MLGILRIRAFLVVVLIVLVVGESYYKTLGVSRSASVREIKRAYRKLALELHPDKVGPDAPPEVLNRFMAVQEAYEVLSNAESRALYDEVGDAAFANENSARRQQQDGGMQMYSEVELDVFSRFPSGAFTMKWRPAAARSAGSVVRELLISFEEVYMGTTVTFNASRFRLCGHCKGTGAAGAEHVHVCEVCAGTGRQQKEWYGEGGYAQGSRLKCPACMGTGKGVGQACPVCGGRRVMEDVAEFSITVPKGSAPGSQYRVQGQGHQSPGLTTGDIIGIVQWKPHPVFSIVAPERAADLQMTMTINLAEALLGFNKTIRHLDGHAVAIARDEVTFAGASVTLEGEGFPMGLNENGAMLYGSLTVNFRVNFPSRLDPLLLRALQDLLGEREAAMLEEIVAMQASSEADYAWRNAPVAELPHTSSCLVNDWFVCPNQPQTTYKWILRYPKCRPPKNVGFDNAHDANAPEYPKDIVQWHGQVTQDEIALASYWKTYC